MPSTQQGVAQPRFPAPTDDKRWRIVNATMRRHGYAANALIETLHTVQDVFGCIEPSSVQWVARNLRVPPSRAYGVATFYNYFHMKPSGEHVCEVCLGTACYIQGAPGLLSAVKDAAGIKPGETSEDGVASLVTVRCVGCCSNAPVAIYDGRVVSTVTPESIKAQLAQWRGKSHDPATDAERAGIESEKGQSEKGETEKGGEDTASVGRERVATTA